MCVIIYKPANVTLPTQELEQAYWQNTDGVGIAVRTAGKIHVKKHVWSLAEFMTEWQMVAEQEVLLHFRYATLGTVSAANCHPFVVGPLVVAHNGHIHGYGDKHISDTRHWCDQWLAPLVRKRLTVKGIASAIKKDFPTQRFALLPVYGNPELIGGSWHKGAWYSNRDFAYAPGDTWRYGAEPMAATALYDQINEVLDSMSIEDVGYRELIETLKYLEQQLDVEVDWYGKDIV